MANQSKPFRFLDLPPELRVRVYSYLFEFEHPLTIDPDGLWLEGDWDEKEKVWRRQCITTGLLVSCKTIHREATPVLYGSNTFHGNGNRRFLQHIRRYIPHVRRFVMAHSAKTHRHGDLVLLKAATSLSHLEIPSLYCNTYSWQRDHSKEDIRQALAKEMGPLFRSLHKSQKKDLDKKDRDVLDVLVISADWVRGPGKDKVMEEAKQDENRIKETLRKTLK